MRTPGLKGPFHFVGIGGAGMSPLAEILRAQGHQVSGSDEKSSEATSRLAAMGVTIFGNHQATNVRGARRVIWSSAIKPTNPEIAEARRLGLPVIHRGDLLEAVMAPFGTRVAVCGSHGKTTTTAMVTSILAAAGFDPTALVGGKFGGSPTGARVGRGPAFVAEADESDRSFLRLHPTVSVVTNIDREHLDTYTDMADVTAAFAAFTARVPAHGTAVLCADDRVTASLAPGLRARSLTYGFSEGASVRGHLSLSAEGLPRVLGTSPSGSFTFTLRVSGEMNALNALGAMAVAEALEVPAALAARTLSEFRGVARRLEWKGCRNGIDVWDDYGHHPTEISATLKALRGRNAGRRLVALFQPHRYTRTRALWNEFTDAFTLCDEVWFSSIYGAGEAPEVGVTSEALVDDLVARGQTARFAGSLYEARARVLPLLREGDVFLTLGAGNVGEVGEAFLAQSVVNR